MSYLARSLCRLLALSVLLQCACATRSEPPPAASIAALAADSALQQLGRPYRHGGASPAGFDCSGLVYYAFQQAGARIARSSELQFRDTRPVPFAALRRGDLLFFNIEGKLAHVAIYLDNGRFVHAPSTGKAVEMASLDSDYYRRHLVASRRFDR
jgi:cell wall-associated NlpC family hydrolase